MYILSFEKKCRNTEDELTPVDTTHIDDQEEVDGMDDQVDDTARSNTVRE